MDNRKKAIGIFSIAAIVAIGALTLLSGVASAAVINVPDNYTTIQAAINAVDAFNRTIEVDASAYNATETIDVNKPNIIIRSVNGRAVIDANGADDHVVKITDQTNVTLQGFEIRDAQGRYVQVGFILAVAGIYIYNISLCNISDNTVTNISGQFGAYGIYMIDSCNSTFSDNTVTNISGDSAYGIYMIDSCNNTFSSSISISNITGVNYAFGIWLDDSSNNIFSSSISVSNITRSATGGYSYGIWLDDSSNNIFSSSISVSNVMTLDLATAIGIRLFNSNNNTFSSSISVSNIAPWIVDGISLLLSNNNTFSSSISVSNITATFWANGISLSSSCNNNFSSSISVSNVTANDSIYAYFGSANGISLEYSNNNTFSSSISVSNVTSTSENAYGIYLGASSNNKFSSSTAISHLTAINYYAYGIYLLNSDGNYVNGVTITPTINGGLGSCEFWSDELCDDNVVTDMTIGNPTTISFTYGNGIWIKRVNVSERPGDPGDYRNISKYINASNLTANSWLFVNFSYNDGDVYDAGITEGTLKVWKYNGTWNEEGWNESRVLDTVNNVVGVNITRFCIFAPLGYASTSIIIPTATGSGDATITTSSGYFCDVAALNDSYFLGNVPDSPVTFFHGFFNLSICGLNDTNPETITINFTFPSAIPTDAEFWKYNASNGTWYRYPFGDNDGDNVISITITDNGPGDHNPANGTITDPSGIGLPIAPVPTLSPIGMLALIGVLSAIAAVTIVRKRR